MQHINETTKIYFPTEKQILAVSAMNTDAHTKDQTSPSASGGGSTHTANANINPPQAYFM
jgi:hypothetical protein